jgi:predicted deacylase
LITIKTEFYDTYLYLKPTAIAKKKEIVIAGQSIPAGEKTKINIRLAKLPSGTVIDLPVYIFRSKNEGPTILLSGGLHGDEINGIEIVRSLIDRGHFENLKRGSVVAIPIMNIYGFLNFSRDVPDGKDVNRSFPGSTTGSLASRIAHFISHNILKEIDFGIDFHTGGASRFNFPQIRHAAKDKKALEHAKSTGAPLIMQSAFLDKSLRKQAFKMGKTMLVFEGGESMRMDEEIVEAGVLSALHLLFKNDMIEVELPETAESILCEKSIWIRAKRSGIYRGVLKSGMTVTKGDILGYITDPFGEFSMNIKSPSNGFVVCHNNMPVVNQGDALIHLGLLT